MHLEFTASYRPPVYQAGRIWPVEFAATMDGQGETFWVLRIYFRPLLILLAALAVAGWLLVATTLYLWLNHLPHNQTSWLDLAAPWRWSGLPAKRGNAMVLTAKDELKAGDYAGAYYDLRIGVARSPDNVAGRLMLAGLQVGTAPAKAVATVEAGLRPGGVTPPLVDGLLELYGRFQIQSHAVGVIDGVLQGHADPLSPESRFKLERARVLLLIELGRQAEADAALSAIKPPTAADAASLVNPRIDLLLRTRHADEAAKFLAEQPGADTLLHLRQAAEIAMARGDAEALQDALLRLKARAPGDAGVYLFAFQAWHRMDRLSYRDAAEAEYFHLFSTNDAALQAIAALAVNLNLPEVIDRAERASIAAKHSAFAFRVHRTELSLRRGEVGEATRLLADWEQGIGTLKGPQRFYPEFIRLLTRAAASGSSAQVDELLNHLAAHGRQELIPVYNLAVSVLRKAGQTAAADQVLQAALQVYPQSEPLLQDKAEGAVASAAKPMTPAPEQPMAAGPELPETVTAARARLEMLLRSGSVTGTRDLIQAIRTQAPPWEPLLDTELSAAEVELGCLTREPLFSRTAVRGYLDRYRSEDDVLRLVQAAARLSAHSHEDSARLLAQEIEASSATTARVRKELAALNLGMELPAGLDSQPAALATFDRLIATRQWAQADRLLSQLRTQPPDWAAADPFEMKLREVQIRLGLEQRVYALSILRDVVLKPGAPRSASFKLVRDVLARGDRDTALLLAREVLRLLPDDPAAARLAREVEHPEPPASAAASGK